MLESVAGILSGESNFQNVLTFVGIYLFLLWLSFCMWVFVDALKRFDNVFIATILFIVVLILNFPALIFYLVIRPDQDEDNILVLRDGYGNSTEGGVNVPLVNFIGEDGVAISFQLKINKAAMASQALANMKIDVGFDDNNTNSFKVEEKTEKILDTSDKTTEIIDSQYKGNIRLNESVSKIKGVGKRAVNKIKSKLKFPSRKVSEIEIVENKVEESVKKDSDSKTLNS